MLNKKGELYIIDYGYSKLKEGKFIIHDYKPKKRKKKYLLFSGSESCCK